MNEDTGTTKVEATGAETEAEAKPKRKANRMTEEMVGELYPHAIPGSLRFLDNEDKQAVEIACTFVQGSEWDVEAEKWVTPTDAEPCGRKRTVRTSDLFQVNKCEACTLKARRAKAKAKRRAKKAKEAKEDEASDN
jgi:hypothetical protein